MEKAFHKLFGKPEGFWGRIGGNIMARSNVEINRWTVALLPLQSEDTVLEIGFGPGVALELMSKIITKGKIFGIDSSEVMLLQAKRRNAQAIKEGRVELRLADVSQLPSFETPLDKVLSVNSVLFWQQPNHRLKQIRELMKPGGQIALTVQPRMKGATHETTLAIGQDISEFLSEAGFSNIKLEFKPVKPVHAVCVLGVNG